MNKIIVTIICIIVVICAMFTAVIIMNNGKEESPKTIVTEEIAEENILDDCTEEYEEIETQNMLQANSDEEKISPNCSFIQKIYYKKCGHTISKYLELPNELVNLTKQEVEEKYTGWKLEKFASNEIVLYKEVDTECDEHYLVKDKEGKITIYKILENGTEEEFERTEISTEYLTDTDKINMKNGIKVNGKQELNQLIEDFE